MPVDSKKLQSIFLAALDSPNRAALLERECAGDEELRQRVEKLLAAHDDSQPLPPVPEQPACTIHHTPLAETVGATIGPYKLKEKIGEGGFGLVFVAEQTEPVRRKVALKVIKPGMDSRQVIARFEAERQALALMDHPNIAKVLDAGATTSGRPYFVMELVRGIPITEYCDKNQLAPKERLELFITVCHAIQHAHQKGVIHRDIKPSNVLVTAHDGAPVPKVIDFGVAKAISQQLTDHSIYTNFAQMIGTPLYMSPEQAEMSGLDIDTRSDIYSLGVLLYELLTGSTPIEKQRFARAAYDEVRRLIREEEPPKPSTRLSTSESAASIAASRHMEPAKLSRLVRGDLDWITMRALEKDRTRRYETANGLARDIQRYLADEPVEACPPSATYRLRKFARKNRGILTTASAIALLLLVGVVAFAWQARLAQSQRDIAIKAREAETEQRKLAESAREEALAQKTRAETQQAEARRQEAQAQEQKAEAQRQAAIAEAVVKFQTDMLAAVDPRRLPVDPVTLEPLKDSVTVLQAMQAAIKVLDEGNLQDQPLVEANVRETIGRTLKALGRFSEAEPNLLKALELRRAALVAGHPDIARSLNLVASLRHDQDQLDQAEPLLREALAIQRAAFPAGHPEIAATLNNLGTLLRDQNRLAEAEPLLREALQISRETRPAGHPDIARDLSDLAKLLRAQNKLAEAEKLFREALDINRAAFPAGHPDISSSLGDLAVLLQVMDKLAEAETLYREALAIDRAAFTAGHPYIASDLVDLARLLEAQQKFSEAEPLFREALEILRAALPEGHRNIAKALNNVATVLTAQNKLAEAEPVCREALEAMREALPAGHPEIAIALNNLAAILAEQTRYAEAEPLYREALAIERAGRPAGHPEIATELNNLAWLLWRQGKLDQSIPMFEEALSIREASFGRQHRETLSTIANLGVNYKNAGRLSEAIPLLEEAYRASKQQPSIAWVDFSLLDAYAKAADPDQPESIARFIALVQEVLSDIRAKRPENGPELGRYLFMSGQSLVKLKAWAEAEPLLRESLALSEKFGPDEWQTFNIMSMLGGALLGQKKYAEAEPLLLAGYSGMQEREAAIPPQGKVLISEALDRLIELFTATDQPDEVLKWQAEREKYADLPREPGKQ